MKMRLTLLPAMLIFALACSAQRGVSSQDKATSQTTPAPATQATPPANAQSSPKENPMKALRDKLLTSSAKDVLRGEDAKAKVWGVLMEVAFPDGVATLVSLRDGTASLYTSTGGGILGGLSAVNEAKRFVAEAEKHLASMKPTKSFPYPEAGRMKFYVLTRSGVYTAEGAEPEVTHQGHTLFPLFLMGNDVLTALRTKSQAAKP
jgi:hypothetical protein